MPEGDTLHRAARRLQVLVGQRIEAESPHPRAQAERVAERVDGRVLESVDAVGKNLILRFEDGVVVRSHLRMSGRWSVRPRGDRRAADGTRYLGETLLDQSIVAGIGNMWAAEVLWAAELSPWSRLRDVGVDARRRALEIAAERMRASVDTGRSDPHRVYRRVGRPCPRCGARIRSWGQGDDNRMTYWCPGCQGGGPA